MAYKVENKSLFELARAFGDEGAKFALDATERSVAEATLAAENQLGRCLQQAWPGTTAADNIRRRTLVNPRGIFGVVTLTHDWWEVIAGGKNVPAHQIRPKTTGPKAAMIIPVFTLKKPVRASHKLTDGGRALRITGTVNHPGYKGKDCLTDAMRVGDRTLRQRMGRAALALARKLVRGK